MEKNFKGILETLRNRAFVSRADIYFFPATDIGMARSGNRNVIRDLAIELGYNYLFATSFLNLATGKDSSDPNHLGLEGNAIMTRLPLSHLRVIPLDNFQDGMISKRLGCQKVLLADLSLPNGQKLSVACVNMPQMSSQRGRGRLMKRIVSRIKRDGAMPPVLMGGDFKTSIYNLRSHRSFFMSALNKRYRGLDYIVQEHHTRPELHFEKRLFDALKHGGFDFEHLNEMGKAGYHSKPYDLIDDFDESRRTDRMIKKVFQPFDGLLSYKYDWFAGNAAIKVSESHQAERPKVISHLFYDGRPVSAHDPILLDFEVMDPT